MKCCCKNNGKKSDVDLCKRAKELAFCIAIARPYQFLPVTETEFDSDKHQLLLPATITNNLPGKKPGARIQKSHSVLSGMAFFINQVLSRLG